MKLLWLQTWRSHRTRITRMEEKARRGAFRMGNESRSEAQPAVPLSTLSGMLTQRVGGGGRGGGGGPALPSLLPSFPPPARVAQSHRRGTSLSGLLLVEEETGGGSSVSPDRLWSACRSSWPASFGGERWPLEASSRPGGPLRRRFKESSSQVLLGTRTTRSPRQSFFPGPRGGTAFAIPFCWQTPKERKLKCGTRRWQGPDNPSRPAAETERTTLGGGSLGS